MQRSPQFLGPYGALNIAAAHGAGKAVKHYPVSSPDLAFHL